LHWKVSFEPRAVARFAPSTHSSTRFTRLLPRAIARIVWWPCLRFRVFRRTVGPLRRCFLPPAAPFAGEVELTVTVNGADSLEFPAVSEASTTYVYVAPARAPVSTKLGFEVVPMVVPSRSTRYPATWKSSVDGCQPRCSP